MIVVGRGLLGSRFSREKSTLSNVIFASGVSDSNSTSSLQFDRETTLLKSWLQRSQDLVYFSTCSIDDPNMSGKPYVAHKLKMEELVLRNSGGIVLRLPQVVGRSDNKNTLVNFLVSKIFRGEFYTLYAGAIRNLIDIDDVVKLTMFLLENKFPPGRYSFAMPIDYEVTEIVSCIEKVLRKSSLHKLQKDQSFSYPKSPFIEFAIDSGIICCQDDYLEKLITKHYAVQLN